MAPFPIEELLGKTGAYLIYFLIGLSFGAVLEMAGFAISTKLAAQFYFKDMTVLKVMFTAIVTAMVLIFLASGLGLLDYNRIWVNSTYLWPGIVGGFIMGLGFIIGGFCPGTSLVAVATLKIDGMFFAAGALAGILVFGETVNSIAKFWNSSYMGRFTLPELFGLSTGLVVFLVVLMALFMFWGGEQLERIFGGKDPKRAPKLRYVGAGLLGLAAVGLIIIGQPTIGDKWERVAAEKDLLLSNREVQIHPGELLDLMHDDQLNLVMLDVREEGDYNQFHIVDAQRIPVDGVAVQVPTLLTEPENTVFVVMSNGEGKATEAWKILVAESVPNAYILEGGVNYWLGTFDQTGPAAPVPDDDTLHHEFNGALGSRYPAADPDPEAFELEYTPKVEIETKSGPSAGGCG